MILTASDRPKEPEWVHVMEIHTTNRVYRLFTDDLIVKEQWCLALDDYLRDRAKLEEE